ncbi:Uncharacterized protein Fot_03562 [Forsythia ovata]|uniref:Uncharacterized protein n=1 Tax=Forsythia ovata TaxID=205694 RepID=A0ABD1XA17_9LAMI
MSVLNPTDRHEIFPLPSSSLFVSYSLSSLTSHNTSSLNQPPEPPLPTDPSRCSPLTSPAVAVQPITLLTVTQNITSMTLIGAVEIENTHGDGENDEVLDDEIDGVGVLYNA